MRQFIGATVIIVLFACLVAKYEVQVKNLKEPKKVSSYLKANQTGFVTLLDSNANIIGWFYDTTGAQVKLCP